MHVLRSVYFLAPRSHRDEAQLFKNPAPHVEVGPTGSARQRSTARLPCCSRVKRSSPVLLGASRGRGPEVARAGAGCGRSACNTRRLSPGLDTFVGESVDLEPA